MVKYVLASPSQASPLLHHKKKNVLSCDFSKLILLTMAATWEEILILIILNPFLLGVTECHFLHLKAS